MFKYCIINLMVRQIKETKTIEITPPVSQNGSGEVIILSKDSVRPYVPKDPSVAYLDQIARNFIVGNETISRSRDVRRDLEERVTKRIGRKGKYLVDKIFELIEGIYVVDNVAGKAVRYYKTPPNLSAIIYALDRVLGKPKQTVDKTEEKKGIYVVEHIIKTLATPQPQQTNGQGIGNNVGDGSPDTISRGISSAGAVA